MRADLIYMSAILKPKTETQPYTFTCCSVWVRNLVTDPKGSTDLLEGLRTGCLTEKLDLRENKQ
jgi:hypothetical protein